MNSTSEGQAKGIVIAVDAVRSIFAVQTEKGPCAVFCQQAGPVIGPGDVLHGAVLAFGPGTLSHVNGPCMAVGTSGPVSRTDALALVRGNEKSEQSDNQNNWNNSSN